MTKGCKYFLDHKISVPFGSILSDKLLMPLNKQILFVYDELLKNVYCINALFLNIKILQKKKLSV